MKIAIQLPQFMGYPDLLERAVFADRLGFHSIWLNDHFIHFMAPERDHPEALTLLTALAARTELTRLGMLVFCNGYRNPAYLAKALTAVDHVSNGRLEIGIGAGWYEQEHRSYGFDFPPIGERLKGLEEALQIMNLMFTEPVATFKGRYHSIEGAYNNPKPLQRPRPPITIAGGGEKVLLRLVARYADRWNIFPAGATDFEHKLNVLKAHCAAIGRDFGTLEVSEHILVCLETTEAAVKERWAQDSRHPMMRGARDRVVMGTPASVIAQLREREGRGVQMGIAWFTDFGRPRTLEIFAREVMPALA
ncbi:MAG TPA: TIGR03560 family F420-dependent LLM class oxidoreductase [Candidatus Binataceae bacterium]|nr:TIGR03560 family F420-dependent LLM class oxidoreductase [Candidatus Binataceae bacterium]